MTLKDSISLNYKVFVAAIALEVGTVFFYNATRKNNLFALFLKLHNVA